MRVSLVFDAKWAWDVSGGPIMTFGFEELNSPSPKFNNYGLHFFLD